MAATFESATVPLLTGLRDASDDMFERLLREERLAGAAYHLRRLRDEAAALASPDEERIIAQLAVDGFHRWGRLSDTLIDALTFTTAVDGDVREFPFSYRYGKLADSDPRVRRSTYDSVEQAIQTVETPIAETLSAITGWRITLGRRRGVDPVDDAMKKNAVRRETVDLMIDVLHAERGRLHRYLHEKARILGLPSLGIYDRSAPLPSRTPVTGDIGFARNTIVEAFERICPPLAASSRRAIANHWIDSEQRSGKAGGGFCYMSPLLRQQRIFLTYDGSFIAMTILAHELGHAFHNVVLANERYWAQDLSAALAETASNVAETFLRNAVLADPEAASDAKIAILGAQLDASVNNLLRIPRDYTFELSLYRARSQEDVDAPALRGLMRAAHEHWFAGALTDGGDELAWASIRHFSFTTMPFYNFGYTMGFLLAQRIARDFLRGDAGVIDRYVAFLRAAGSAGVEDAVSATLGYDLTTAAFWRTSLDAVDDQVAQLVELSRV